MDEIKETPKPKKKGNWAAVFTFFVLEIVALVAFTFTGSFFVYALFGMVLFFALGMFTYDGWKKDGDLSFLIFSIPLILYALLSAVSKFSLSCIDIANNLLTFIGLISFLFIGYMVRFIKGFKIKHALLAIYGGVFILMLISLILTLVYYSPFYTIIHAKNYFYYDGTRFAIAESIIQLVGFSFEEVPLTYFTLFGVILFTAIVALRFISPKKEPRLFAVYTAFALLGFLILLFFPTKYTIVTDAFILLFVLYMMFIPKYGKPAKAFKIVFGIIVALGSLYILTIIIAAQGNKLTEFLASNKLTNKLFIANAWSSAFLNASAGLFNSQFIFGHQAVVGVGNTFVGVAGLNGTISTFSNSWFFDSFYTSGVFGVVAISVFVIFTYFSCKRYYVKSKDSTCDKSLVITLIWSFFIYGMFNLPFIAETHKALFSSLMRCAPFLIVLFLIGYIYTPKDKKKKEIKEVAANE